jgi:hypothetical protein
VSDAVEAALAAKGRHPDEIQADLFIFIKVTIEPTSSPPF